MPLDAKTRRERRHYNAPPLARIPAKCKKCGADYGRNPHREDHEFCSDRCRKQWHKDGGTALPQMLERVRLEVQAELDRRAGPVEQLIAFMQTATMQMAGLRKELDAAQRKIRKLSGTAEDKRQAKHAPNVQLTLPGRRATSKRR